MPTELEIAAGLGIAALALAEPEQPKKPGYKRQAKPIPAPPIQSIRQVQLLQSDQLGRATIAPPISVTLGPSFRLDTLPKTFQPSGQGQAKVAPSLEGDLLIDDMQDIYRIGVALAPAIIAASEKPDLIDFSRLKNVAQRVRWRTREAKIAVNKAIAQSLEEIGGLHTDPPNPWIPVNPGAYDLGPGTGYGDNKYVVPSDAAWAIADDLQYIEPFAHCLDIASLHALNLVMGVRRKKEYGSPFDANMFDKALRDAVGGAGKAMLSILNGADPSASASQVLPKEINDLIKKAATGDWIGVLQEIVSLGLNALFQAIAQAIGRRAWETEVHKKLVLAIDTVARESGARYRSALEALGYGMTAQLDPTPSPLNVWTQTAPHGIPPGPVIFWGTYACEGFFVWQSFLGQQKFATTTIPEDDISSQNIVQASKKQPHGDRLSNPRKSGIAKP